jgi:ribose transport system ATP-binding protein
MDEPTTSLTEPEIERVFELMKQLQAQNVGMIFISHKLGEVLFVCTRYTVLRDGHLIQSGNTKETTSSDLAYYMVGHKVSTEAVSRNMNAGEEMLKVEHYGDGKHFHDISLSVKKSEILGITGLLGDGRSELFLSLFGAKSAETGSVYLNGEKVSFQSTQDAVKHGFAYVPRNRKENGILKDMSILENGTLVTLPDYKKGILIDSKMQKETFHKQVCKIHIKMGDDSDLITSLSGGNQQKVILTRWLNAQPKVLVMDNPTQGVDIGAKEEIYAVIRQIAEEGVAVVILSSEAQEIMQVCDRALVMFHGKIMGEVSGNTMNEHTIMRLATGECINEV